MIDWKTLTPQEVLDGYPVLTMDQAAYVLGFVNDNGKLERGEVHKLIRAGRLCIIDSAQPITRWAVSSTMVRLYIHGDRRAATGFKVTDEMVDAFIRGQTMLAIDQVTYVGPRKARQQ